MEPFGYLIFVLWADFNLADAQRDDVPNLVCGVAESAPLPLQC